jgi:hypothetical protein
MRYALPLLVILGFALSGCELVVRDNNPPGKAKHADGPGNSENAPGHNKKK